MEKWEWDGILHILPVAAPPWLVVKKGDGILHLLLVGEPLRYVGSEEMGCYSIKITKRSVCHLGMLVGKGWDSLLQYIDMANC